MSRANLASSSSQSLSRSGSSPHSTPTPSPDAPSRALARPHSGQTSPLFPAAGNNNQQPSSSVSLHFNAEVTNSTLNLGIQYLLPNTSNQPSSQSALPQIVEEPDAKVNVLGMSRPFGPPTMFGLPAGGETPLERGASSASNVSQPGALEFKNSTDNRARESSSDPLIPGVNRFDSANDEYKGHANRRTSSAGSNQQPPASSEHHYPSEGYGHRSSSADSTSEKLLPTSGSSDVDSSQVEGAPHPSERNSLRQASPGFSILADVVPVAIEPTNTASMGGTPIGVFITTGGESYVFNAINAFNTKFFGIIYGVAYLVISAKGLETINKNFKLQNVQKISDFSFTSATNGATVVVDTYMVVFTSFVRGKFFHEKGKTITPDIRDFMLGYARNFINVKNGELKDLLPIILKTGELISIVGTSANFYDSAYKGTEFLQLNDENNIIPNIAGDLEAFLRYTTVLQSIHNFPNSATKLKSKCEEAKRKGRLAEAAFYAKLTLIHITMCLIYSDASHVPTLTGEDDWHIRPFELRNIFCYMSIAGSFISQFVLSATGCFMVFDIDNWIENPVSYLVTLLLLSTTVPGNFGLLQSDPNKPTYLSQALGPKYTDEVQNAVFASGVYVSDIQYFPAMHAMVKAWPNIASADIVFSVKLKSWGRKVSNCFIGTVSSVKNCMVATPGAVKGAFSWTASTVVKAFSCCSRNATRGDQGYGALTEDTNTA